MQTTKAQISQRTCAVLPHAKNKIPARHACADPDNSNRGGGGGRIASRWRFVPVFLLGNKWQLMIFMGRSGPPAPSVSAHIRVSNSLNSHFIYLFCWAWSIHKTSANYISWRQGQRQHDPFSDQRDRAHQFRPRVVLKFGVARDDGLDARKCTLAYTLNSGPCVMNSSNRVHARIQEFLSGGGGGEVRTPNPPMEPHVGSPDATVCLQNHGLSNFK